MTGAIPAFSGDRAFRLSNVARPDVPVLIAVPHAGRAYSAEMRAAMRDPELAGRRLEDRHVDAIGVRIAESTGAALLVAEAPRAAIDLNRSEHDIDWGMVRGPKLDTKRVNRHGHRAHNGLGLIPRRLQGMGDIWRNPLVKDDIETRIVQIYRPYHAALSDGLFAIRKRWGAALLLDLHSMPPLRSSGAWEPARYVIGDRFGASCDAAIPAAGFAHFARIGTQVAHNRPYAGGYVLERHGAPARNIHAVQLEVDRSLYLDDALDGLHDDIDPLVDDLSALVRVLASTVADLANARSDWRDAAE